VVKMFVIIIMHLCGLSFQKKLSIDLVEKTRQTYVLLVLVERMSKTRSLHLWMSKMTDDFFALTI